MLTISVYFNIRSHRSCNLTIVVHHLCYSVLCSCCVVRCCLLRVSASFFLSSPFFFVYSIFFPFHPNNLFLLCLFDCLLGIVGGLAINNITFKWRLCFSLLIFCSSCCLFVLLACFFIFFYLPFFKQLSVCRLDMT